jgi:hypothetical protein
MSNEMTNGERIVAGAAQIKREREAAAADRAAQQAAKGQASKR